MRFRRSPFHCTECLCYNILSEFELEGTIILEIIRHSIKNKKLSPWIKFIWQIQVLEANLHYKLLPTDSIDVIVNLASDMVYEVDGNKITAPRFHINGLRCRHSYIHQENKVSAFGISFYPYGLYPFVNKPIKGLHHEVMDLFDFAPDLARRLKLAVAAAENKSAFPIETFIEQALLLELAVRDGYQEKARLISDFMSADHMETVKFFCDQHFLNMKTFERTVLTCTGFTPKALQNIKRFQAASNQLSQESGTSLAGIAADHQFADQAHFTKEFRRYSGAAPGRFISDKISVKENAVYTYR